MLLRSEAAQIARGIADIEPSGIGSFDQSTGSLKTRGAGPTQSLATARAAQPRVTRRRAQPVVTGPWTPRAMATRPDPVDAFKTTNDEFARKTKAPHAMEHEEIHEIDKVDGMHPECTGETTLVALADHAAKNAEGAPLDISALRQHRLAGTKLCDLADDDTGNGLSAFLSALTAIDVATGDVVHADGKAIAEKVRPFLNAGVCKYLKGKRKTMLAEERKRSAAFRREVEKNIRRRIG